MNNNRMANAGTDSIRLVGNAWTRFWFTPVAPTGLRCLRVLSGLLFCAYLLSFLGHQKEFFSLAGWVDTETHKAFYRQDTQRPDFVRQRNPAIAPVGWSIFYQAGENAALFQTMYFGSLVVLGAFTVGIATRVTSVLSWIIMASFLANPALSYEGDELLAILAFYMMLAHLFVGQWSGNLSIAERILGARSDFVAAPWIWPENEAAPASHAANLFTRMLQIHFVIVMLSSAFHKLQLMEWLAGVALWYPLHPTMQTTLDVIEREKPNRDFTLFYLGLIQYAALAWQLALPTFAWRDGWCWRGVLLGGAVAGWLGTAFIYSLPSFGPFVMICTLSFLRPHEWNWILTRLQSLRGNAEVDESVAESKKIPVTAGKETGIKK